MKNVRHCVVHIVYSTVLWCCCTFVIVSRQYLAFNFTVLYCTFIMVGRQFCELPGPVLARGRNSEL